MAALKPTITKFGEIELFCHWQGLMMVTPLTIRWWQRFSEYNILQLPANAAARIRAKRVGSSLGLLRSGAFGDIKLELPRVFPVKPTRIVRFRWENN